KSTTSSGTRASLVGSACGWPLWWASARRATHSAAVAKATRCPAWQARMARPVARGGLPVPGGPGETTLSRAVRRVEGAQGGDDLAFEAPGVVEAERPQALAGGETGGADAALAAVGLPGGDLTPQAGHQVFLV